MLAYLASTLAFSAMARAEGQLSEILSTHLHLAKSQPSFLYWAQRSDSPSRPAEERLGLGWTRSLSETLPINQKTHLVWWSLHLFHLDQLCLCPPEDQPDLCYVQEPPVEKKKPRLVCVHKLLTLMPTTMPLSLMTWGKSLPLFDFW